MNLQGDKKNLSNEKFYKKIAKLGKEKSNSKTSNAKLREHAQCVDAKTKTDRNTVDSMPHKSAYNLLRWT